MLITMAAGKRTNSFHIAKQLEKVWEYRQTVHFYAAKNLHLKAKY